MTNQRGREKRSQTPYSKPIGLLTVWYRYVFAPLSKIAHCILYVPEKQVTTFRKLQVIFKRSSKVKILSSWSEKTRLYTIVLRIHYRTEIVLFGLYSFLHRWSLRQPSLWALKKIGSYSKLWY